MSNIRNQFGMGRKEFGALLGYEGDPRNVWITIKRYEIEQRTIPPRTERVVLLLHWYYEATGRLPDFESMRMAG